MVIKSKKEQTNKHTAANLDLLGGRLCLDFANTADWHAGPNPQEHLISYADLLAWGRHAEALTSGQVENMLSLAEHCPAEAATVLERAIALREDIYRIFVAVTKGVPPPTDDLATLNAVLNEAIIHRRVVYTGSGFAWEWDNSDALDYILWPIACSAAELLTSPDLARVRQCAGDPCGWLFLDESRNRSRRWCDMRSCGNRAKARRHYRRTVAAAP
ncbi:MAG: CGNR zinc finger domain-containing protein [Anaerolineae bacterium]